METEFTSVSGLLLMFVLGLRHGPDSDHIVMIGGIVAYEIASHETHVNAPAWQPSGSCRPWRCCLEISGFPAIP